MRIPLERESSSARPVVMNIVANDNPAARASKFPNKYPPESLSKKNKEIPMEVTTTVPTSMLRNFCLKISADSTRIKIGAVYCKTMALAEVVNLFAAIKKRNVKESEMPLKIEYLFITNVIFSCRMYKKNTIADIKLLVPAIAIEFQGNTLIKKPAVLHRTAQITMYKIA